MKKSIYFILIIFILLCMLSPVFAFSSDTFSITVPDGYTESQNEETYAFEKDKNNNIAVTVVPTSSNLSLNSYIRTKNLDSYILELKELYLEKLDTDIEVLEKTKDFSINNYPAIKFEIKLIKYSIYREIIITKSDHYNYNVTLTSTSPDYFSSDEMEACKNSFTILDTNNNTGSAQMQIIISWIIFGVLFAIAIVLFIIQKRLKIKSRTWFPATILLLIQFLGILGDFSSILHFDSFSYVLGVYSLAITACLLLLLPIIFDKIKKAKKKKEENTKNTQ